MTDTAPDLATLEKKVDVGFTRVDGHLAVIDERFKRVDDRFADIDRRFKRIDDTLAEIRKSLAQTGGRS